MSTSNSGPTAEDLKVWACRVFVSQLPPGLYVQSVQALGSYPGPSECGQSAHVLFGFVDGILACILFA